MGQNGAHTLPADLLHSLSDQLAAEKDFGTLYRCVLSSKQLATAGAIAALYRISHDSPIKSGGSEALSFAEQDVNVMRWSIFWRTIILSTLGKTLYRYCRHLRALDLRDLSDLLERLGEPKFAGKVAKHFFEGDLQRFHLVILSSVRGRSARLDIKKILNAVGDEVTAHAPLLEVLSEPSMVDVLSGALSSWAPRLNYLQELELSDGKLLADETLRSLVHVHCSKLSRIRFYKFTGEDTDRHLASFIYGLRANTLIKFENISSCGIGPETMLALNRHGESLKSVQLALEEDGILALGLLQSCTKLRALNIESLRPSVDLKATQNDVYLEIVEWLRNCNDLREVSFAYVLSAPDLAMPILLNPNVRLEEFRIQAKDVSSFVVKDNHDFFAALTTQHKSLQEVDIYADPDPPSRDDNDMLVTTIGALSELRSLKLARASEYFSDDQVTAMVKRLCHLEDLTIGGFGITDAVLPTVGSLKKLKNVTFSGVTSFTTAGLLDFVDLLGPDNEGIVLSVDLADQDNALSDEAQDLVKDSIAAKVNGRFEYQLLRDPNVPDFDTDDDD